MMADIAEMTEPHLDYKVFIEHRSMDGREKISSAVALATVRTAKNLKANAYRNTDNEWKYSQTDLQFPPEGSNLCDHTKLNHPA